MDNCHPETVTVKILFFAKSRELAGVSESQLIVYKNTSTFDLKEKIILTFGLESIKNNFVLAVDEEFIEEDEQLDLSDKSVVAVIPPLSGGNFSSTLIYLSSDTYTNK